MPDRPAVIQKRRTPPRSAQTDALAGLLDRRSALLALGEMLMRDACPGSRVAAFWLNIDRFKQVNDSFGHLTGDNLLAQIVQRLQAASAGRGQIARMGGDEFALVVPACDQACAERMAHELLSCIMQPIEFGGLRLRPAISIGIALSQPDEPAHLLLERADHAMMTAKRQGGGQYLMAGDLPAFGHQMHLAREELETEEILHRALETGGLSLAYQPILRAADRSLEGVEALMRCQVDGLPVPPGRFIPVAEKTGLIFRLGEWGLLTASRFVGQLRSDGQPIRVAVNVSRAQLTAPKFSQSLHATLACSDSVADLIELEITESLFMDRSEIVQQNIRAALEAGYKLAIDDFGTGYSCLAVLKDLPANKLKIDRAFIADLPGNDRSLAITRAIVQLATDLGMTVVAEGVETAEQYEVLCEAGVTAIQGYHLAHPMDEASLAQWLQDRNTP